MRYFGFDKPSFAFKSIGSAVGVALSANFVTGEYALNGATKTFTDLFAFNRAGKAWLVKDRGLVEYAIDVPRFDNGLLIEQEATNYARYSSDTYRSMEIKGTGSRTNLTDFNLGVDGFVSWGGASIYSEIPSNTSVVHSIYTLNEHVCFSMAAALSQTAYAFEGAVSKGSEVLAFVCEKNRVALSVYPSAIKYTNFRIANATSLSTTGGLLKLIGYRQTELGTEASSYVKTTDLITTRPADYLLNKITGTTLTGDWDATLNLSLVNGQLSWTGYGRIRSLEIT